MAPGSNLYASVTFNEKAQLDFFKPMVSQSEPSQNSDRVQGSDDEGLYPEP